ncbi:hypothetical protein PsYK624_163670 [Phanerochaete sordida]|uniref:Uncharacterized protein n=1 Tax=Phanerochaete sordida TaxID=48140 RepID=A0A9P3GRB8_9APHY|nr:hypothetical protein PsYK624_163670 [Phanerochaete sordida]
MRLRAEAGPLSCATRGGWSFHSTTLLAARCSVTHAITRLSAVFPMKFKLGRSDEADYVDDCTHGDLVLCPR